MIAEKVRPAPPPRYDGDRLKGKAFYNSLMGYFRLRPDLFPDESTMISWALTFMSAGRAALWSCRIFELIEEGSSPYATWDHFAEDFRKEFFPLREQETAALILEGTSYFQGDRSVDDYVDSFRDLVAEAGYSDPSYIVVKFRRGLHPSITDHLSKRVASHPAHNDPSGWYELARLVALNLAANDTFHLQPPPPVPSPLSSLPPSFSHFLDPSPGPLSIRTTHAPLRKPVTSEVSVQTPAQAPPLPCPKVVLDSRNRYAPLVDETLSLPDEDKVPSSPSSLHDPSAPPRLPRRSKWECRRLPSSCTISSLAPGPSSLHLKVEIETTDSHEARSVKALLDTGATGLFIDREYVKSNRIATRKLSRPIPVRNVDGTLNESGSITEVVDLILRYNGHTERALFCVTGLGKQKLIIGYTWFRDHNPEVNWETGEVKMSRCKPSSRCFGCKKELNEEKKAARKEEAKVNACCSGPAPSLTPEESSPEDSDDLESSDLPFDLEEGDRVWVSGLLPEEAEEHINATSTISQRLAEGFLRNSAPQPEQTTLPSSPHGPVPDYQSLFHRVFSEAEFLKLPERRPWDHAIELIPGAQPKRCKIYPLNPAECEEAERFLAENEAQGKIRRSKSPMASPVFFVKKKDGSLRLVQDYRMLNDMTVKNKYPLPLISDLINQLRGARYFTKLDIRWGFNNVRIKEGDEWKAAFRTHRGLFEPLVMFFGLTNSPATFQTMMNEIFQDMISEGVVVVYLDDILIFTKDIPEHREVTHRVLKRLEEHGLCLRLEKCEFEKTCIEYLGLIVAEN